MEAGAFARAKLQSHGRFDWHRDLEPGTRDTPPHPISPSHRTANCRFKANRHKADTQLNYRLAAEAIAAVASPPCDGAGAHHRAGQVAGVGSAVKRAVLAPLPEPSLTRRIAGARTMRDRCFVCRGHRRAARPAHLSPGCRSRPDTDGRAGGGGPAEVAADRADRRRHEGHGQRQASRVRWTGRREHRGGHVRRPGRVCHDRAIGDKRDFGRTRTVVGVHGGTDAPRRCGSKATSPNRERTGDEHRWST